MVLLHARWPGALSVKLYVDDLTLSASGLPQWVIRVIAEAIDFAVEYLEVGLLMQVSVKKSKVIASRSTVAAAILEATVTQRVSADTHAKLLGTDTVGGRRRCTQTFRQRLKVFSGSIGRFQALRKIGTNSTQMVRTAGIPALLYGCETFGVSDTTLDTTRSKVAKAASRDSCGRNPVLTLLALDGEEGTLDPAFEAHVSPVQHWALAIWDDWFPAQVICRAYVAANDKLRHCGTHIWQRVNGPATALVATVSRLGWKMESPFTVTADDGQQLDFRLDPPVAVARAVKDGVRRWRWRQAGAILPGLIPTRTDAGSGAASESDIIVGCFSGMSRLLRGKQCPKAAGPVADLWVPKFSSHLASAVNGGQWTQMRKASVEKFGITDGRCQLCLEAPGTAEHRFTCRMTMPKQGWPSPPPAAAKALNTVGSRRREILKHRGLLALRLPPRIRDQSGEFSWLVSPHGHASLDEAIWYFDGSMLMGKWRPFRVTGYGIAVVTTDGTLIGYGFGWPPSWCTTAAAAEAWALSTVLTQVPFPPQMRTDCLSLLHTAREGTSKATHHSKPLARVWKIIAEATGADVASIMQSELLVWFPAHKSLNAVGELKGSNGRRLTIVDWRANRLVDKLAKIAATAQRTSKHIRELLPSADAAVAHAACLLGAVTHAANNHEVTAIDGDGETTTTVCRDSTDKPKAKRTNSAPAADRSVNGSQPTPREPAAAASKNVKPWTPPSAFVLAKREAAANLDRRVADIGAALVPSTALPAGTRLAQLAARVKAKATPH